MTATRSAASRRTPTSASSSSNRSKFGHGVVVYGARIFALDGLGGVAGYRHQELADHDLHVAVLGDDRALLADALQLAAAGTGHRGVGEHHRPGLAQQERKRVV